MKILVVAPHADDETIGLGGTIAKHISAGDNVTVAIMTGHGEGTHPLWPQSAWDRVRNEARAAMGILGVSDLLFEELPAVLVPEQPVWRLNSVTAKLVERVQPDVLYVPFPFDLHKDHREVFHSMSVAWRPSSPHGRRIRAVYCYEVLSETHWNIPYVEAGFLPAAWVDISAFLDLKLRALACYESQVRPSPDPRSLEAVRALATFRGHQMGLVAAEAFVVVRLIH